MADIVLGVGSSHSSQPSTSGAFWAQHAARDETSKALLGRDGKYYDYAGSLKTADLVIALQLDPGIWEEKFDRAQRRVEELSEQLSKARFGVVVVVGDDQRELFGTDGVLAIALFTGEEVWDLPPSQEHNVPSAGRCHRLGEAIGEAIASFSADERVALVASGGLSHFVVLGAFHRWALDAPGNDDAKGLADLPADLLRSQTSDSLNWVTVAGACRRLSFELVDYLPAYCPVAGTGVGMAFGLWRPAAGATDDGRRGQGAICA